MTSFVDSHCHINFPELYQNIDDIFSHFRDIFGDFGFGGFGRSGRTGGGQRVNRGSNLRVKVKLTLEEIVKGAEKKIKVKKGTITITFLNPLTTKTYYTIEIPSFTKDGIPVR